MKMSDEILLEKYFRNFLNEEEKNLFEKRKLDSAFNEQFIIEKQLFESLNEKKWSFIDNVDEQTISEYKELFNSEDIQKLKLTLSNGDFNKVDIASRQFNWKPFIYAAAASVVLLISVFGFNNNSSDVEDIYATYLDKSQLTYSVVRDGNSDNGIDKVRELFFENDYEQVTLLIEDYIQESESGDLPTLYLMKGVSLTELGSFEKAIAVYEQLINSDYLDAEKGYWYKGLLYLKKGDADNALTMFQKIETEKLYNHNKAAEIVELLK